jgi:hypothetical protein
MKADKKQTRKSPLTRIQKAQKARRNPTHTIAYRLDEEYLSRLENLARKRGNSVHEQAREMLMALLDGDAAELLAMRLKVEEVSTRFEEYTAGMADVMEAVLVMSGGKTEKVRPWIDERLRKRAVN